MTSSSEVAPVYGIVPTDVVVEEGRHRKKFDVAAHKTLVSSIKRLGQLQPGICTLRDEDVVLIAGERRLRACLALEIPFQYILKEEIADPILLKEIELEENLQRCELEWNEQCVALEELHRLKQEKHGKPAPGRRGGWGIEDTAKLIGASSGGVSQDLKLAFWAKEVEEVATAATKKEAKKIVQRLEETLKTREAIEQASDSIEKAPGAGSPPGNPTGDLASTMEDYNPNDETKSASAVTTKEAAQQYMDERIRFFNKRIVLGTLEEELPKLEKKAQVVIFDPPWGVDYANVRTAETGKKEYEDNPEDYLKQLEKWLTIIWDTMASDSHLYMFFGMVNHHFVYSTLEKIGFETNWLPLIWHKVGAHRVRQPQLWPGRCYEPIAFAHKGRKELTRKGLPDVIPTERAPQSVSKIHTSPKHPSIILSLLRRSCYPGDLILDPMAGSGVTGVAAEVIQQEFPIEFLLVEKEPVYRDNAILNMTRGFSELCNDRADPDLSTEEETAAEKAVRKADTYLENHKPPELPDDFRELTPGTDKWKRYWREHPEQQEAMLAWKKEGETNGETSTTG